MKNIECACGRARWTIHYTMDKPSLRCKYCLRIAGTISGFRIHDDCDSDYYYISNVVDGEYWIRCEECETMIGYLKPRLPVKDMRI